MNTNRNTVVEEYYRDNYKTLIKSVKGRVGEGPAEDVVQEAFTRCIRFFDGYNPERGSFDTWFRIILTNVTNRYLNAERSGGSYSDEGLEEVEIKDENLMSVTRDEIRELISYKLGEEREVLNMYYTLGYSLRDISSLVTMKYKIIDHTIQDFKNEVGKRYA